MLPAKQNASLVKLPTSQAASIGVATDQRNVKLAKAQEHLPIIQRNAPILGNIVEVARDKVPLVVSMGNQDSVGATHTDEIPVVDALTPDKIDLIDPNSRPVSLHIADDPPAPYRSSTPERSTLPGM